MLMNSSRKAAGYACLARTKPRVQLPEPQKHNVASSQKVEAEEASVQDYCGYTVSLRPTWDNKTCLKKKRQRRRKGRRKNELSNKSKVESN